MVALLPTGRRGTPKARCLKNEYKASADHSTPRAWTREGSCQIHHIRGLRAVSQVHPAGLRCSQTRTTDRATPFHLQAQRPPTSLQPALASLDGSTGIPALSKAHTALSNGSSDPHRRLRASTHGDSSQLDPRSPRSLTTQSVCQTPSGCPGAFRLLSFKEGFIHHCPRRITRSNCHCCHCCPDLPVPLHKPRVTAQRSPTPQPYKRTRRGLSAESTRPGGLRECFLGARRKQALGGRVQRHLRDARKRLRTWVGFPRHTHAWELSGYYE